MATEDLLSKCPLDSNKTKAAYISISGLPNVGKSTLLNYILGTKINAVSSKPQTTRENILGILTDKNTQLLFIDTPGYHQSEKELNKFLIKEAVTAYKEADIIVYMFDAMSINYIKKDKEFFDLIRKDDTSKVIIPVISKIDLLSRQELAEAILTIDKIFKFTNPAIPLSVHKKTSNVNILINELKKHAPESPFYYKENELTNRDSRFLSAELIREKIFAFTNQELPYSVAVKITKYKEEKKLHRISADIYVERDSQKPIILGKKGEGIKRIGMAARQNIERMLGVKVYLELFVKVKKNWTKDATLLKELGYDNTK